MTTESLRSPRVDAAARLALAACAAVLAASGCVAAEPAYPRVRGVQIVSPEDAAREGWHSEPVLLRFGDRQDGTELVVRFLESAAKRGAVAVGELSIVHVTPRDGRPTRCVTRIGLQTEVRRQTKRVYTPPRTRRTYRLKPVTRTVTESRYRCRSVRRPVTRSETTYESRYDVSSRSYRCTPRTRMVTRYEHRNECRYEPVTRMVTRYEYQYDTQYIPPRWNAISRQYAHHELVEREPVCSPTDSGAPGAQAHTISGVLYFDEAREP